MKLKIVSGGHADTTHIIDAETGADFSDQLFMTRIEIDVKDGFARATIQSVALPFEIVVNDPHINRGQTLLYDPDDTDSIDQAIARLMQRRTERMLS